MYVLYIYIYNKFSFSSIKAISHSISKNLLEEWFIFNLLKQNLNVQNIKNALILAILSILCAEQPIALVEKNLKFNIKDNNPK